MTERSVTHATFAIERIYNAPPARVFAAWATAEAKASWFAADEEGWETGKLTLSLVCRKTGPQPIVTAFVETARQVAGRR